MKVIMDADSLVKLIKAKAKESPFLKRKPLWKEMSFSFSQGFLFREKLV